MLVPLAKTWAQDWKDNIPSKFPAWSFHFIDSNVNYEIGHSACKAS